MINRNESRLIAQERRNLANRPPSGNRKASQVMAGSRTMNAGKSAAVKPEAN